MPENGMPGPVCDLSSVKESVCIHTKKILDGCRDKDCVEDLRFYPTQAAQEVLSGTQIIKMTAAFRLTGASTRNSVTGASIA